MKQIAFFLAFFVLCHNAFSQKKMKVWTQDDGLYSVEKIIEKLTASGVEVLEVKTNFESHSQALGYFSDPSRQTGLQQGMVLSTGTVVNIARSTQEENFTSLALSPEQSKTLIEAIQSGKVDSTKLQDALASITMAGDADLSAAIDGTPTYDARVIEISFIPSADTLYFRYIFASEEYDEFVCSPYNDVFGFFLSEESGERQNIALVPNKNIPISINNVNNGNPDNPSCPRSNAYLYKRNKGKQDFLYDGYTKVLDIRQKVTPGKKYVLKIAIADASDQILDSAVFIENGSIFSYFNSFELQYTKNAHIAEQEKALNDIVETLKKHANSKIQLIGHCDISGSESFNMELSKKRVEWLVDYLVQKGIAIERILCSYQGELMPRYEKQALNRRVEVFVVGE